MAKSDKKPKEGVDEQNSVENAEKFNRKAKEAADKEKNKDTVTFFERRWFREWMVFIRRKINTEPKSFYIKYGSILLALVIVSVILDAFTPFENWWMIARSAMLIPLGYFGYSVAYAVSLFLGDRLIENNPDWVPYRARFSPRWRLNFSILGAAAILVVLYAFDTFVGYTAFSAVIVLIALGMIAFTRRTRSEQKRAEYGIPDPRDVLFEQRVAEQQREREQRREDREISDEDIPLDDDERVIQSHRDKR